MKKITFILFTCLVLLGFPACEKGFEELNKNPFDPTQVEMGPLFNSVIQSLQLGWNEQLYLHNETLYKITQQASRTAPTFQNVSIGTEEAWNKYYGALTDIREIESRLDNYDGEQEAVANVRAMLKVVLAYKTFRVTDYFGDIPFSEAGRGFENLDLVRPKFDTQEEIYKTLLDELKWVNDNANLDMDPVTASGAEYLSLEGFDKLFNEDMEMWVKFGNSLRLRHAVRMYDKDPNFAGAVISDVIGNNLPLIDEGEDVGMWPSRQGWKNEGVQWSFAQHKQMRLGTNIWNLMAEHDSLDGSGIFDKRLHVFFETNNAGEWVAFPQIPDEDTPVAGGAPYEKLRDDNYSFKGVSNIYSPFNYYLIRDEDYIPELIFTAAEVDFLKAEIYYRGLGVPVNIDEAKTTYKSGVTTSIVFWHNLANSTAIWVNEVPTLDINEQYSIYNNENIDFTDAIDPLQNIYTQRWIDAFRQPWEAYALGRRTMATPVEGEREVHYRFTYPPSEVENNPENWSEQVGRMGSDEVDVKVWWMQ